MPSGERVWMIFSRSSTAIWWVSRSESLERDVRILCLSSIMARWDEREDEEDLEGVVVDVFEDDWFGGFESLEGFVACKLIVTLVAERERERVSQTLERKGY